LIFFSIYFDNLLRRTGQLPQFLTYHVLTTIISILTLVWSSSADLQLVGFITVSCARPLYKSAIATKPFDPLVIERVVLTEFIAVINRRYSSLNYVSRQRTNIDHVPQILTDLMISCVGTITILLQQEQYAITATLLICNATALALIVRPHVRRIRDEQVAQATKRRKLNDRSASQSARSVPRQ
jgi:hypothetical protein